MLLLATVVVAVAVAAVVADGVMTAAATPAASVATTVAVAGICPLQCHSCCFLLPLSVAASSLAVFCAHGD